MCVSAAAARALCLSPRRGGGGIGAQGTLPCRAPCRAPCRFFGPPPQGGGEGGVLFPTDDTARTHGTEKKYVRPGSLSLSLFLGPPAFHPSSSGSRSRALASAPTGSAQQRKNHLSPRFFPRFFHLRFFHPRFFPRATGGGCFLLSCRFLRKRASRAERWFRAPLFRSLLACCRNHPAKEQLRGGDDLLPS